MLKNGKYNIFISNKIFNKLKKGRNSSKLVMYKRTTKELEYNL
jgi:hypothetical protein